MSDISWIKLKTFMFDDEKIQLIEAMPEADAILVIWVKLLIQAGKTNSNGYILLSENIPYSPEMLSTIFRRPLQIIKFALKVLSDLGMIEVTDSNVICIANWEKHQNIEGLDKVREQNRIRQAKFREVKRLNPPQKGNNSNVTVTESNATDRDIEKDLDLESITQEFEHFWNLYDKKVGSKTKLLKKWSKLTQKKKKRFLSTCRFIKKHSQRNSIGKTPKLI